MALVVIDSSEGIVAQDRHIAGYAGDAGKGVVVIANKWDLVPQEDRADPETLKKIAAAFDFVPGLVLTVSALLGRNVPKVLDTAAQVADARATRMSRAREYARRSEPGQSARMRLLFGLCSTSAVPSTSMTGGTYIANLPLRPFFRPYHPPTGFFAERPQASTVPSLAGFCSSALPSSIQSPCFLSIAWRSSRQRRSYFSWVFPTCTTRPRGLEALVPVRLEL